MEGLGAFPRQPPGLGCAGELQRGCGHGGDSRLGAGAAKAHACSSARAWVCKAPARSLHAYCPHPRFGAATLSGEVKLVALGAPAEARGWGDVGRPASLEGTSRWEPAWGRRETGA